MGFKKILILTDLQHHGAELQDGAKLITEEPQWDCERAVFQELQASCAQVDMFCLYDRVQALIDRIENAKKSGSPYELVFNLCEAFAGDRRLEAQIVSVLELLRIPFTGNSSRALQLCRDKALSKYYLHEFGVDSPRFQVSLQHRPIKEFKRLNFPVFVKPLDRDASEGISDNSRCEHVEGALERVHFLHRKLQCDVIVEEFIPGRELSMAVLGNGLNPKKLKCLPIRELSFDHAQDPSQKFATYKSKWDPTYREKWGIRTGFASDLNTAFRERMESQCRLAFEALHLNGYARFDFRYDTLQDRLVLIEVNPNPSLDPADDLVQSAQAAGISWRELLKIIMKISLLIH